MSLQSDAPRLVVLGLLLRKRCVMGRRRPTPIALREMIRVGGNCLRLNSFVGDSTRLRIAYTIFGSCPEAMISSGEAFCSKYIFRIGSSLSYGGSDCSSSCPG